MLYNFSMVIPYHGESRLRPRGAARHEGERRDGAAAAEVLVIAPIRARREYQLARPGRQVTMHHVGHLWPNLQNILFLTEF